MDSDLEVPIPRRGSEFKLVIEAERTGDVFLLLRDADKDLDLRVIADGRFTIGRSVENDLTIDWDSQMSRLHAEVENRRGHWMLIDDGLSRNGSFVGGERVIGRRRLTDGDLIRLGQTNLVFRSPNSSGSTMTTHVGSLEMAAPELSPGQLKVLIALSRPVLGDDEMAIPATNRDIAEELFLSVDAVKGHLRVLFQKFGLGDLPQNRKRASLVYRGIATGIVTKASIRDR